MNASRRPRIDRGPRRFREAPRIDLVGSRVPIASTLPARMLGLALLDREAAGDGLLIPRCRSVHTFGMRFPLDLVFLDGRLRPLRRVERVPRRRFLRDGRAAAVLELPAASLRGRTG